MDGIKITIKINTGGSAFRDEEDNFDGVEVERIIRKYIHVQNFIEGKTNIVKLMDINGNTVGTATWEGIEE